MKHDTAWFLVKSPSPSLSKNVSLWAAYNSLARNVSTLTSVALLPVINGRPTMWQNIYKAIKEAQDLSKKIYPEGKTIISFDLQLHIKAIRPQIRPEIKAGFVFRMGELHVVFCVLKALGKMIDGSGLDQVFEEANLTRIIIAVTLRFY